MGLRIRSTQGSALFASLKAQFTFALRKRRLLLVGTPSLYFGEGVMRHDIEWRVDGLYCKSHSLADEGTTLSWSSQFRVFLDPLYRQYFTLGSIIAADATICDSIEQRG